MTKFLPIPVERQTEPLGFRSLLVHAWDLADSGSDCLLDRVSQAGLNTPCLAGTYHNGLADSSAKLPPQSLSEQQLMVLCACADCILQTTTEGMEMHEVRKLIGEILDGAFREAPQQPKHHPRVPAELEVKSSELKNLSCGAKVR